MTTQYDSGRRSSGGFFAIFVALVLGAAGLAVFLRNADNGLPAKLARLIAGSGNRFDHNDISVPTVVEKIQRLSRLETVVYSLDTVVEGSRTTPPLPDLLGGDKVLLVVHGESIGGVDLAQLRPEDVVIAPARDAAGRSSEAGQRSIKITLPASQLFVTTLDEQRTRVYARTTGLLVPADQNLESDTRAKAQLQLQQAALNDGILDAARKNARATITTLLYGLGFQKVAVL